MERLNCDRDGHSRGKGGMTTSFKKLDEGDFGSCWESMPGRGGMRGRETCNLRALLSGLGGEGRMGEGLRRWE